MSTEQHDACEEEPARIRQHQSEAMTARISVSEALTRAGVSPAQADGLVSQLEAGAVAGAHTWICREQHPARFGGGIRGGWFQGARAVPSNLLRITDTTAAQRGRADGLPWPGRRSGSVARVEEAAAHTRARYSRPAGARPEQRPPAGKLTELGRQGRATIDFPGPPAGDVQQQPIQRPANEHGVGLVRERPRVGVVVVTAVDPAAQQGRDVVTQASRAASRDWHARGVTVRGVQPLGASSQELNALFTDPDSCYKQLLGMPGEGESVNVLAQWCTRLAWQMRSAVCSVSKFHSRRSLVSPPRVARVRP